MFYRKIGTYKHLIFQPVFRKYEEAHWKKKVLEHGKIILRGIFRPAQRQGNVEGLENARLLQKIESEELILVFLYRPELNQVEVFELPKGTNDEN